MYTWSRHRRNNAVLSAPVLFLLLVTVATSLDSSPNKFQRRKNRPSPSAIAPQHDHSQPSSQAHKSSTNCDHPSHQSATESHFGNRTSRAISHHSNSTSVPSKITSSIVSVTDKFGNVERVTDEELGEVAIPLPCFKVGYVKHPKDCSRFYRCFKADTNEQKDNSHTNKHQFRCPPGLIFDEVHEICNWPSWSPSCQGSGEIYQVQKKKYTCPSYGYFQDPSDCSYFYYCSNFGKRTLQPYEFKCPFNLAFDEEKLVCNWKWLVKGCKEALNPESAEKMSESTFNAQYLDSAMTDVDAADQSLEDLSDDSLEKRSDDEDDVEFVESGSVTGKDSVIPAEHRNSELSSFKFGGRRSFARSIKDAVSGAIDTVNTKVKSILGMENPNGEKSTDAMEKRQDFLIDPTLIAEESIISNLFQNMNPFGNNVNQNNNKKKKPAARSQRPDPKNSREKFVSIPVIEVDDRSAALPLRGRRNEQRGARTRARNEPVNPRRKPAQAPRKPPTKPVNVQRRPVSNRPAHPTNRPAKLSTAPELIPVPILTVRETPKPHLSNRKPVVVPLQPRKPLGNQRERNQPPRRPQEVPRRQEEIRRPEVPLHRGQKPPALGHRQAHPQPQRAPARPQEVRHHSPPRQVRPAAPQNVGHRQHHHAVPQALPSINVPHSREPPPRVNQVSPKKAKPSDKHVTGSIQAQLPVELFSNYDVDIKQLDVHPLFTAGGNIDLSQLSFLPSVGEAIHDALVTKKPFGMPHSGPLPPNRQRHPPRQQVPVHPRPLPPHPGQAQNPRQRPPQPHPDSSERIAEHERPPLNRHHNTDRRIPLDSRERLTVERLPVERVPVDHLPSLAQLDQDQIQAHNLKQLQKLREQESGHQRAPVVNQAAAHSRPSDVPAPNRGQAHHLHHDFSATSYQASGSDIQQQYQINLLPEKLAPQPDNHFNIPSTTVTKNGFKPISPVGPQYQHSASPSTTSNNYYQPLSNLNNYQYSQPSYGLRGVPSSTHSPYAWSQPSEATVAPGLAVDNKTSKSSLLIIPVPDNHPKAESLSDIITMSKEYPHLFPAGFDFKKVASITRSKSEAPSSSPQFNSGFSGYNSPNFKNNRKNDTLKSDYIIMTVNEDSLHQEKPVTSETNYQTHHVSNDGRSTKAPVVIKLEIPEGKPEVVKTIVDQVKQTLTKVTGAPRDVPTSRPAASTASPLYVTISSTTVSPVAPSEESLFENKNIPQSLYESIQQVIAQHLLQQQLIAGKTPESTPSTSTTQVPDDDLSITTLAPTVADTVTPSSSTGSQAILESIPYNYFLNQNGSDPVSPGWPYPQPWFQHPYAPYYPHQPVYGHPTINQTSQYFPYPAYPAYQPSWPGTGNYSNAFSGWYEWAYGQPGTSGSSVPPSQSPSTAPVEQTPTTTPASPSPTSPPNKQITNSYYITVTTTSAAPITTPTTTPQPPTQWQHPSSTYHYSPSVSTTRVPSEVSSDGGFDLLRTKTTQPDTPQIQVYIVQGPNGPQVQTKTVNPKDGSKQPNVQVYVIDENQKHNQKKQQGNKYYQYAHENNYQGEESQRRDTTIDPPGDLYKDEVGYTSPAPPSLSTGDIRSQSSQSSKVPSLQSLYNSGHPGLKNFTDAAVPESACTRPGLFQHPNDCNKFYECYFDRYIKKYTLHLFECPVKVAFDSRIVGCSGPTDPTVCVQY